MDIDLSSDPSNFIKMHNQLEEGYDLVIGSRQLDPALVERAFQRRMISLVYRTLVRSCLKLPFMDYQCGFKLFKRDKVLPLIARIKNDNWFFDTELIFYAQKQGLKIKELAINWKESKRKSRVNLIGTVLEDIGGIIYLKKLSGGKGRKNKAGKL